MQILLTGLNYRTAPIEVREKVAFSREQLTEALPTLADRVGQGVILSTCNRTEVYAVTEHPKEMAAEIGSFLSDYHGVDSQTIEPLLHVTTNEDAVRHLFRVASGLDSMILGESEVLGQMRNALTAASDAQSLGPPVSRLFHRAIRTGRRVRHETAIGRNPLSVSYAAVRLAQRVLGDLAGLRVLLLGAGEAGKLVARALGTTGVDELVIANRTEARGRELARELGGRAIPFPEVESTLTGIDIVIAATEATEYVLTGDAVAASAAARNGRALFLFDLSVPRNIEPTAASTDNVSLFNIDDLTSIAEENLSERKQAAQEAEKIVEEEVAEFLDWWGTLDAVPLIKAMRDEAERIRGDELARALGGLSELSDEQEETLEAMTRSIVNRMLHNPTISLKKRGADEDHLRSARDLFGL